MKHTEKILKTEPSEENFNNLNKQISESQKEVKLTRNYAYNTNTDSNYTSGINITKNNYILDGDGHSIDAKCKASVFDVTGENITIKNLIIKNAFNGTINLNQASATYHLENITIQNSSSPETTGGICLTMCNVVINNSRFISNNGGESSDIFTSKDSNLTVVNSTFEGEKDNKWSHIACYDGELIVENSTFINSHSHYSNAILGENVQVTVRNSKFRNLTAYETAGAIAVKKTSDLTVINCDFTDVSAFKNGGMIFADINDGYEVKIVNSTFNEGFSQFGGTIMQLGGNLFISNSTIKDTQATFDGAAVWTSYANVSIENSTIKNNTHLRKDLEIGGTLYFDNGDINIKSSTFTDNHGSGNSDVIFTYDSKLTLENNTFKDNGLAVYTVFGTENISSNNIFNNDRVSVNNTYYSTNMFNKGVKLNLKNQTVYNNTLPEKFNLKDEGLVGPVRDQGIMGSCWTFATTSALESALLKSTGKLYDFSQDHMQNTMLQYSLNGVNGIVEGAIQSTGVGYTVNWYGPYPTMRDTYDELGKVSQHINIENESIHIQDVMFIPSRQNATDNDIFKKVLMDHGAFMIALYFGESSKYFNQETASRYYNGNKSLNHAVTLVGWDDNFSASNFLVTPPGDGAWIIKNSWGTNWGKDGYFYLSYYDRSIDGYPFYAAYVFNNTVPYNKNYQTDAGQISAIAQEYKYYSNTYTASEDDLIAAVGTYFEEPDIEYNFDIYVNNELKHTQSGLSPFSGYHTIKLTEYIPISANDTFKVVFKNNSLPYESTSRQHHKTNTSFASSDGVNWEDVGIENVTVILKVYTVENNAVLTVDPIKDIKIGDTIKITGRFVDKENNSITNAPLNVKVNNETYIVITDNYGNYELSYTNNKGGINNVNVMSLDREYWAANTNTTFTAKKLNVSVSVYEIIGTIGEDITLRATITDENGNPVDGGNLVFKMNGRTLRIDGQFNSDKTPYKFKVKDGIVTFTLQATKYIRNAKNLTASYSGNYKYVEAKANVADVKIQKRKAQVSVSITPNNTRQNNDIVFTATLYDVTKNANNTNCLTENASIIFKVNGVTIKSSNNIVNKIQVNSTVVNYVYHIPSGMGGANANGTKDYVVEAVYDNPLFYPNTRNSSIFNVQRSKVNINFINTTVNNNVLSLKATFTDFEDKYLVGTNKVCVKINGKTYQENGHAKYFNITDGKVDLTGIKLANNTKVKEVMLVTGANQGYLEARATTKDIQTI